MTGVFIRKGTEKDTHGMTQSCKPRNVESQNNQEEVRKNLPQISEGVLFY